MGYNVRIAVHAGDCEITLTPVVGARTLPRVYDS